MPKHIMAFTNFYQNANGVVMSKQEYIFFTKMYWDGYQKFVTLNEFMDLKEKDFFNHRIEKQILDNYITLYSTKRETNSKILQISKVCSSDCLIALTANWKKVPNVKSYDVIGARLTAIYQ